MVTSLHYSNFEKINTNPIMKVEVVSNWIYRVFIIQ